VHGEQAVSWPPAHNWQEILASLPALARDYIV